MRIAVFLLGMCAMLNLYVTQPILVAIRDWAQVPDTAAAWTISACTLGVAVTAPFAGAISDRYGRKKLILLSLVVMAATSAICAMPPRFEVILALRFLQGVCIPFVFAIVVAYMAEEFEAGDAAKLNALYVAGTASGGFSGRFLAGAVVHWTDHWSLVFLPIVAIQVVTLVAVFLILPNERSFVPSASISAGLRGLGSVIRQPALIGTCAIGASLLFLQVTTFTYGSIHLQAEPFWLSPFQTSLVYLVMLIPTFVTPGIGVVIARTGELRMFTLGVMLCLVGLAVMSVPFTAAMVIGLAGTSLAVFIGQACCTRFTARTFTRSRSSAVGWYLAAYYIGGTIGGVAPAPIYVAFGWIAVLVLLGVIIIAAGSIARVSWR